MEENDKDKSKENEANEPFAPYTGTGKKLSELFPGIHISTLQEQEDQMREYSASLTPVERMAYLQYLIRLTWGDELDDPDNKLWNKNIVIDKRP